MVPFGWGMMEVTVSVLNGVFKQTDASLCGFLFGSFISSEKVYCSVYCRW